MASTLDSARKLVHGTTTALLDNKVPDRLSDVITTAVKSGFDVIRDSLKVIQDLTKPAETSPPEQRGGP